MWICQKCNRQNIGKFCVNCGVVADVQVAPLNKVGFTKKPLFVGCFVVGVLMFIGTIFVIVFMGKMSMEEDFRKADEQYKEKRKKRTAETVGKITDYVAGSGSRRRDYIHYDFVVDGKTHSDKTWVPYAEQMKFSIGKEGSVCYDPADPKNNRISFKGENRECGY